jgi:hypothetical protein
MDSHLHRRELLKVLGAAAFAAPLQLAAADPGAPLFFTKDEFALLDHLTELLVPTDDHSPGAHQAGVAAYIDRFVAEAFLPEEKASWRNGLASIDALSRSTSEQSFLKTSRHQQIALLTRLAANENNAKTASEKFFTQLKQTTAFAYYTSKIGIHSEMGYLGNVLLDKFVGYEVT